ncbi:N-acetyltransferase [Parapedobacter lycopersici]|uniref:GNAT family N-acetyltransferase n=1 Tax=Parapedobacter lycopersici TaxID=1864939 RepID=UPI00333FAD34
MEVIIRKEEETDFSATFEVVRRAFEHEVQSDHQEQFLVERLRNSDAFVPELSLVAEIGGRLVGYVLLTRINISNESGQEAVALALAPIAVLPEYQGKGIGGRLMQAAHQQAIALGFGAIVLLGHENYYPKFGYRLAREFGIALPFEVPDENCMAIELIEGALQHVSGTVKYPAAFGL